MPPKSKKQKKFMQAVANNPKFAKKVGVPTKVGKEFTKETEMKYEKGGRVKKEKTKPSRKQVADTVLNPQKTMATVVEGTRRAMEKAGISPVRGTVMPSLGRQERPAGMKKGGAVKSKSKTNRSRGDGICKQGKTKGRMV